MILKGTRSWVPKGETTKRGTTERPGLWARVRGRWVRVKEERRPRKLSPAQVKRKQAEEDLKKYLEEHPELGTYDALVERTNLSILSWESKRVTIDRAKEEMRTLRGGAEPELRHYKYGPRVHDYIEELWKSMRRSSDPEIRKLLSDSVAPDSRNLLANLDAMIVRALVEAEAVGFRRGYDAVSGKHSKYPEEDFELVNLLWKEGMKQEAALRMVAEEKHYPFMPFREQYRAYMRKVRASKE